MFTSESEARRAPFVEDRFELHRSVRESLRGKAPPFGFDGFGELVYYRTYSRLIDGFQEGWADTVIRVVQGCLSIRKDWYRRRGLAWDEGRWQDIGARMAWSIFRMHWLPPGRGLYAMGTAHVYRVGAMPLFNCGAASMSSATYAEDLAWSMDALMCGVGVGFDVTREPVDLTLPCGYAPYLVEDSREGWTTSLEALCNAFLKGHPLPCFDYSGIREAGTPLRGIGGVASGPDPLRILHERVQETFQRALRREISPLRMRADHANQIGACVTMGDVRRSAEMLIGPAGDEEFLRLKDYGANPDRAAWGWASNNTVGVDTPGQITQTARDVAWMPAGERPGILNRMLLRACHDPATLVNPCGEIPLLPFELCNLAEVVPQRCPREEDLREALMLATLYSQTVSLLPTHQARTNAVLVRHRRIGVSLTGVSGEWDNTPRALFETKMRRQWGDVRGHADRYADEAQVARPIFCTTNKPSGSVSQLAGVTSGMHWRTDEYALRRVRVGVHSPVKKILDQSGFPSAVDPDSGASVYAFPIRTLGKRNERDVPLADQFALLEVLQRCWADNSVSCTLKHDAAMPPEELERFLLDAIPQVKCLSILAHEAQGNYALPPYEALTPARFEEEVARLPRVSWSSYRGDGEDAQFCDAKGCDLRTLGTDRASGHHEATSDDGLDPVPPPSEGSVPT